MTDTPGFDAVADRFDSDLQRGLALTGEGKDYFAAGRVRHTQRLLTARGVRPARVLDYGCGNGDTLPLLAQAFVSAEVVGFEPSCGLLEEARKRHPEFRLYGAAEAPPAGDVDLIYCNGVVHHVPPAERPALFACLRAALRAGGHVALFENNPLNPGTRLVMRRIPFDREAIPVMPWEAARLLRGAGLEVCVREFLFFLPHALRALRGLERPLRRLPLGGQYMTLARVPTDDTHGQRTRQDRI